MERVRKREREGGKLIEGQVGRGEERGEGKINIGSKW
jgi:hypothetical protein